MAEDHWIPKPGNSTEPGPEVVERQRVAKKAQRIRSWTEQNEVRDVLERV